MPLLRVLNGPFNTREKCLVFQSSIDNFVIVILRMFVKLARFSYGKVIQTIFSLKRFANAETVLCMYFC